MKSLLLALLLLLGSINCYCQVLRVDGDPFEGNARPNAGLGFDNNNHQYARLIVTSNLSINKMDVRRGGVIVSEPKKEIGRMIIDFLPNYNAVITFYADQCPPLNIKIPNFVMGGWEYEMNILFDNNTPPTSSRLPISFGGKTYGYMIQVPGGTFTMGSNDGDDNEKPPHTVSVNTFYIGETEVTQELWKDVMENNPSRFNNKGDKNPIENITWYDAVMFCNKLSEKNNRTQVYSISNIRYDDSKHKHIIGANVTADFTKNGYRLPTEAEWEFAARGGKSGGTKYSGSDIIDEVAWYGFLDSNDKNRTITTETTKPVAQKKPNSLGIYDMTGNVWEWCYDTPSAATHVLRGGSWGDNANYCRIVKRGIFNPDLWSGSYGLRLALVP